MASQTPREGDQAETPAADSTPWSMLKELSRRRVFRVLGLYLVGAWGTIEVTTTVSEPLGLPAWIDTAVIIATIALFPVALALSWAVDIGPEGLERDPTPAPIRRRIAMLAAALLAGAIAVAVWVFIRAPAAPPRPPTEASIAVLPFANLTGDASNAFIGEALAEELTLKLDKIGGLEVAALTSAFEFGAESASVRETGHKLGVGKILHGSVRRRGEDFTVAIKLTDVADGFLIWTATHDLAPQDLFEVQSRIARAVVENLEILLTGDSARELGERPTENIDAYLAFVKGRAALREPARTQTLDHAEAMFREALRLDMLFGRAYAGLCETYRQRYRLAPQAALIEQADSECQTALRRSPDELDVHIALGRLYRDTGRPEEALRVLEQARRLDPDSAAVHSGLGDVFAARNQPEAAQRYYATAIELEPDNWIWRGRMANFLFERGRYAEAAVHFQREIDLKPENAAAYAYLGGVLFLAGEADEAREALQKSLQLQPSADAHSNLGTIDFFAGRYPEAIGHLRSALELAPGSHAIWGNLADVYLLGTKQRQEALDAYSTAIRLARAQLDVKADDDAALSSLALYLARSAQREEARRLATRAVELDPDNPYNVYYAALVHLELGEPQRALDALERTLTLGYPPALIAADPALQGLRGNRRFEQLLEPPVRAERSPLLFREGQGEIE